MSGRPFAQSDPFLKILVLFLLSFMGIAVFMLMGSGIVKMLWGVNFLGDPTAISDYDDPAVVNINRVLLIFQHLGMFVVPAIAFAMLVSKNWKLRLGFRSTNAKFILASTVLIIAALPIINALGWLNEQMVLPEFLGGLEQMFIELESSASKLTKALTEQTNGAILFVNILTIALLPALGEEMIFRGALIPILKKWTGSVQWAVWISAIIFSAMHLQFYGFLPRMVLGALLGYLFVWSGSLWIPILAHFLNNALALTLIFFMTKGSLGEEVDEFSPGIDDLIWLLISIVIVTACSVFIFRNRKSDQAEILHPESLSDTSTEEF